ncbi:MAG: response regulator transcription factor [Anaerolineae bacterium]|nr:response regulator transcription factor [Anaerolineae bacterium]
MAPIRVVLADDHAVVRRGIREFLETEAGIEVVGEASDGQEAQEMIEALRPDVAVLDVRMPKATGIEVTRHIREKRLNVGVLILTAYDDDPFVMAALQAGANGYVLKTAEAEEITRAVRAVAEGKSALDSAIAAKVIAHVTGGARPADMVEPLSAREVEVLQLAAAGFTNRAIGCRLGISDRTVQGHLANVYGKLQVSSRTEAVTKALQLGVIHLPESED